MSQIPLAGCLLLALVPLALAACRAGEAERAAPQPAPDARTAAAPDTVRPPGSPPFDARQWLRGAAAVWDSATWSGDYEAAMALSRRHADTLDAAISWKAACAEPWGDDGWEADEQTGFMALHPFGDGEHLVEVTCEFGAYQGSYALVHVEGPRATLLRAPDYDPDAGRLGEADAVFSTPAVGEFDPSRTFSTFAKSRGPGDCGVFARYRVGRGAEATVEEVRARACEDNVDPSHEMPPPEDWPVVYPAP